jgi:hypothetical protein
LAAGPATTSARAGEIRSERQKAARRRYRRRQTNGHSVYSVEVERDPTIEALIASGRISEIDTLDPRLVALAIASVVDEWAQRWQGRRD